MSSSEIDQRQKSALMFRDPVMSLETSTKNCANKSHLGSSAQSVWKKYLSLEFLWQVTDGNFFRQTILTLGYTVVWSVTHLDAAIFIYAVVFLWSSQRQTHFGSLVLDQANHLSSYFCTWPLLSNTPSHSCRRPTQHLRLARLLPSQLSGSPSVLIKVIDLPKSCLF